MIRAAIACCMLLPQDAPEALIRKLGSERVEDREAAAAALRAMGERALEPLRNAQSQADPEVRGRAGDLVAELELGPLVPPFFGQWYREGPKILRTAPVVERRAVVQTLLEDDLLPPCLAEQLVLSDPDPILRASAGWALCVRPRLRYREAYFKLLDQLPTLSTVGRPDIGPQSDYFPVLEEFVDALRAVVQRSDEKRLRAMTSHKDPDVAAAADLLLGEIGSGPSRDRLRDIAQERVYPVAALAREQLARRFGPDGVKGLPSPAGIHARWSAEEATLLGLLSNGSPEAVRALEDFAGQLGSSSQRAIRLVSRAGTVRAAKGLLAFREGAREDYLKGNAMEALRAMPWPVVWKAVQERTGGDPVSMAPFARLMMQEADEETILKFLRVVPKEPQGLQGQGPEPRAPIVRACRAILGEKTNPWATRFAYRYLAAHEPEGRAPRAAAVLAQPDHPAFLDAVAHLDLLPERDRAALLPGLAQRLEKATDLPTLHAFARAMRREWVESMKRLAGSKESELCSPARYALAGYEGLTVAERLELARAHDHSAFWESLHGLLPLQTFDDIRESIKTARPHVQRDRARALVASGDTRPFPRVREIVDSGEEYPYTLAALLPLTEGESCIGTLMKAVPRLQEALNTQAAGEMVQALSAFPTPEVESFLLDQLRQGPIRVNVRQLVGPFSPGDPPEEAIASLVNMRSEKYRVMALRVARTYPSFSAVEALGVLRVEGALDEVVSWLEDALRAKAPWRIDVPYLNAMGYLGDERHADLVRAFLDSEETRAAAARTLDRLLRREAYRRLREERTLRGVDNNPATLTRWLKEHWGMDVLLPPGHAGHHYWVRHFPVWRASGFQVLDALSRHLGGMAPLWCEGRVEFLEPEAAARHWKGRR